MSISISHLSGYKIMWLIVMFDLPVTTPKERKAATKFRKDLLDMGFLMTQFSIYCRPANDKQKVKSITASIKRKLPDAGNVNILEITDKQYEKMKCFYGRVKENPEILEQLSLF